MSRRLAVTVALVAAALVPATAHGDGLPLPVDDAGPSGVVSHDGSIRFVTMPGPSGTVVAKVSASSGTILGSRPLPGVFTIPVVALDGTPGGLSHDGRTLALIKPRSGFPRARTAFAFLSTRTMGLRTTTTLRGDFSFDALSPDGRVAYLIQYINKNDPTKYQVRALQTTTGHLSPRPIVDPHEHGDEMNGYPTTRVASADGRWHYTLYDGGATGKPFVHALDTQAGKAKCIDLPGLGRDVYSLHLRVSGGTLAIAGQKRDVAKVDLSTFKASVTSAPPARAAGNAQGGGGSSAPTAWIVALGLALLAAGAGLTARRRRRGAASAA
jgi:LPXTG-motif cell wall-anchored protein